MTNKVVNWECEICELDNVVEVDSDGGGIRVRDQELYCIRCGVATIPQPTKGLINGSGGQWLPCLELTGWAAHTPCGKTPDGFEDGNGGLLSREAYKRKHHIDPDTYWKWKTAGKPKGKSQKSLNPSPMPQTVPSSKIAPFADSNENEAAKLKKEEEDGRLNLTEYLSKLMALLKANKVTREYYDQEVDRVIDKI